MFNKEVIKRFLQSMKYYGIPVIILIHQLGTNIIAVIAIEIENIFKFQKRIYSTKRINEKYSESPFLRSPYLQQHTFPPQQPWMSDAASRSPR